MKTDIDTLIAEVLRLDGEATPEPWVGATDHVGAAHVGVIQAGADDVARGVRRADRRLIAYYRTAAPILAREVQRLCARLALVDDWNAGAEEATGRGWRADPCAHIPPEVHDDESRVVAWLSGWTASAAMARVAEVERERDELRALLDDERCRHQQTARECGDATEELAQRRADLEEARQQRDAARAAAHCWVYEADKREAVALRRALNAEDALEEARLTLAAEQGRQEGAPSPGWEYGVIDEEGGFGWRKKTADGGMIFAWGRGVLLGINGGPDEPHPGGWARWIANEDGDLDDVIAECRNEAWGSRAAMQAADEVSRA